MNDAITKDGIIIKSVGGLNTIETTDGIYTAKARGVFRNNQISPCCGDRVVIQTEDNKDYVITEIKERKNSLIRPVISNLDQIFFVVSTCEPQPNFTLLDKFIAVCVYKKIEPAIIITKIDIGESQIIIDTYNKAGIKVYTVNNLNAKGCKDIIDALKNKISAFTGNTGVGKTSLINNIFPDFNLATNEISKKLGRGKHTTRHVELYKIDDNSYIADTPGFSSFETNRYEMINKNDLASCFTEFAKYTSLCRFKDCSHTNEKGCAVIEAVQKGEISLSRHKSYILMYEEARKIKEWETKK